MIWTKQHWNRIPIGAEAAWVTRSADERHRVSITGIVLRYGSKPAHASCYAAIAIALDRENGLRVVALECDDLPQAQDEVRQQALAWTDEGTAP